MDLFPVGIYLQERMNLFGFTRIGGIYGPVGIHSEERMDLFGFARRNLRTF